MGDKDNVGGKLGDVSGKLGDVSGFAVGGKLGDVSGNETFEEIMGVLTHERHREAVDCLELRVSRLEHLLLAIARWLDRRISVLNDRLEAVENSVANHERRIAKLEKPKGGPQIDD